MFFFNGEGGGLKVVLHTRKISIKNAFSITQVMA